MRFDIITIFPEIFDSYFEESILRRAQEKKLIEIHTHNLRDYTKDKHKKVDDIPFGGGAGMIMTPQPLFDCIAAVRKLNSGPVVFLTPQGKTWTQSKAEKFAESANFSASTKNSNKGVILLCGRYEGIDQRVREQLVDEEISIGKFVLTGGELPAMILIDSITRLIPGALGKEESHLEDSFSKNLNRKKEYPHYTRPANFRGHKVPDVLLSGHHKKIEKWRRDNLK